MIDLPFQPDRTSPQPLYRQLEGYLRGLIETGRLAVGRKLPATRELASALGLGRVTVNQAYEGLGREGLVSAHVGQGTFVATRGAPLEQTAGSASGLSFVWSGLFALRARLLRAPVGLAASSGSGRRLRYDFRGGQVEGDLVPAGELRRALAAALRRRSGELGQHAHPYGWQPLRQEIARILVARGVRCDPREIAVVSGAQQAIDLVARVLVDPGDTVVMEQPGYFGAALAFGACQANLVGVGVDEEGLRTDELARILRARRVKLVYATPGTQSPTGVVMSEARRREFLRLADEHQTPILEDDYAAELRYQGPPVTALKANDDAGQVIYAGTFSKILFPSLRVGYVVAAPAVLEKITLAHWTADAGTALLPQMALATLLRSGELERHFRRVRKAYAERLQTMLEALRRTMPERARWTEPSAGQGVWLELPPGTDGEAVFREALEHGVAYTRGDVFHLDGQGVSQCHLSFAKLPPSRITEGIERLARIVSRHLVHTRRGEGRKPKSEGESHVAKQ